MRGRYGMLYKRKVQYNNRHNKVVVKRFNYDSYMNDTIYSWEHGFFKEFEVLFMHKYENIIGLVGYCNKMDEKIIVYEHASKGSLHRYLMILVLKNLTYFRWKCANLHVVFQSLQILSLTHFPCPLPMPSP
ncbi:putative protein kinase RLK-Pelle-LRR-I-1 family [Helianthus annuus]|nr:putative protein kinase RLK-Pelle-LRR-I-1 family [Helianthus annuus]KAJ0591699.1 putative protein kinase RLK-Pelle-LRR-I-1 family [Helianthus annuus]KAJ0772583.1 putative protein kinase RLK-Pelle-LRR-I-1 family [Helianthus annuus]KAJ0942044.1 putative protein kinase RLK-Pelle-LRR-I-1 family [Helianthus annuus]